MTAGYLDPGAELAVVACAIDNNHASQLAHTRLTADQFADPALAALFTITADLPIVPPDHRVDPWQPPLWQQRAHQAARLTGLPHTQVLELLEQRAVMHDLTGRYARRVADSALLRRQRAELIEALQLLDAGDHARFEHTISRIAYHDTASIP